MPRQAEKAMFVMHDLLWFTTIDSKVITLNNYFIVVVVTLM